MSNQYELLPSSALDSPPLSPRSSSSSTSRSPRSSITAINNRDDSDEDEDLGDHNTIASAEAQLRRDPRFSPPPPSPLKRFALIAFIIFLFWLAFALRSKSWRKQVIHANRYSKEFKFRPAASPVITETLVDGRIKLRGAQPTPTSLPQASKKTIRKKMKGKGKKTRGRKVSKDL